MLELYHYGLSVCAHKVRFALAEKGLAWTSRIVDLHKGEQFSPAYLKLNPSGVVPTLVHDGMPVIESTVINEYLDDAYPDRPLRPSAALARMSMRLWAKRIDDAIHAACGTLTIAAASRVRLAKIHAQGLTVDEYVAQIPDAKRRARQREVLTHGMRAEGVLPAFQAYTAFLSDMEATLGHWHYLAGEEISLADIDLFPYVLRLDMLGMSAAFAERPALLRWYDGLRSRPALQAITDYIHPDETAAMLDYGRQAWCELQALLN